jgi:hypothetical protein
MGGSVCSQGSVLLLLIHIPLRCCRCDHCCDPCYQQQSPSRCHAVANIYACQRSSSSGLLTYVTQSRCRLGSARQQLSGRPAAGPLTR